MKIKEILVEMENIDDISIGINDYYRSSGIIKANVLGYLIQKIINKLINGYFIQMIDVEVDKKNVKIIKYYSRVLKEGFSCCPDVKFNNLEKKIRNIKKELDKLLIDDIIVKDIVLSNLNKENGTFEMNISLELKN